jgi:hypothetical protein
MASRKEQKEALRKERLEREQQSAQAAARKRLIGIVVAAILVLGIVGALAAVVLSGGDDDDGGGGGGSGSETAALSFPDGGEIPDQKQADLETAIEASGCKEETRKAEGSGQHTEDPVNYQTEPPAIGAHNPVAEEDKLFEESADAERIVHALEHGRIVIWVRPDAPEDLRAQLKALYEEDPYHVIMLPRKELKEPVAVSAWVAPDNGHILRCTEPDDQMWDAIRAFKEQYRDKAPEFVP